MNQIKIEKLNEKRSSHSNSGPQEFMVGYVPHRSGTYRIEISGDIEHVDQFSTAIQVLEQAKEEDEVIIYLQTNGGSVDAGEAFIHAMRKCEAPIHIVATGGVHSMGTHILMEGDSLELSSGFNALVHCGSNGAYGTAYEYHTKSAFDADFRVRQFREAYEGMFSSKEIDDILAGKDYWLDGQGWLDRAQKRSDYFRAKFEAQMKPQRKSRTKAVVKKPSANIIVDATTDK